MKLKPITLEELDEAIEDELNVDSSDQLASRQAEMDHIVSLIEKSEHARRALSRCEQHILEEGKKHIMCGLIQSVAAFFVIAQKATERRHLIAPSISELEKMFELETPE